ncbi:MAG: pantoate--beta-alanine ligase [Deltaproteobacteria bacterium CG11_big_fil_rev_8_21_14_0_20_47_16]|nr:MAG: pantoate--beta-alanine ligase [Deltaproteobacteria bacterium CG11_big_fil_rev_8_21_14_0_20_47_16]
MQIITTPNDIQSWAIAARNQNQRIGFVPTMGYLHEGHCSLLKTARQHCDQLVLSIFVNPTQFGPNEDFDRYPKNWEGDLDRAKTCGVDIVFHPDAEGMYPTSDKPNPIEDRVHTWINALHTNGSHDLLHQLCGQFRPGHFQGVATVVAKLFDMVQPHTAYFGEKDYQQLQVIHRMVDDLHVPVEIKGCPIVREADGLAMSSRNTYLSITDRKRALCLYQAIQTAQRLITNGCTNPLRITQAAMECVQSATDRIDYVTLCDAKTLTPLHTWQAPSVLAIAAWIGTTRLIDNVIFP